MIIGFTGKMGVGKSTAIQAIRDFAQDQVTLVKFAQPLYDLQEAAYERIKSVYSRPDDFVKDRKLLQWLGTEWGRGTISQTLWVDLWKAAAKNHPIVVCDDVRFDNEAEAIKSMGGKVVLIQGPSRDAIPGIVNHSSEKGINPTLVDYCLVNEGNKEAFKDRVYDMFKDFGGQLR